MSDRDVFIRVINDMSSQNVKIDLNDLEDWQLKSLCTEIGKILDRDEQPVITELKINEHGNISCTINNRSWEMSFSPQIISKRFLNSVVVDNIVSSYNIHEADKTCLIAELAAEIRKL